jgi:toxin CcdB
MAQYDVYSILGTDDLFLEVQSNRVQGLNTRIGAPLVRKLPSDRPIFRLQPEFFVAGQPHIMLTQYIFSLPVSDLRERLANFRDFDYRISSALDLLFHGV